MRERRESYLIEMREPHRRQRRENQKPKPKREEGTYLRERESVCENQKSK